MKTAMYYEFQPELGEIPKGRMLHLQLLVKRNDHVPYVPPSEFLGLVLNLGAKVQYTNGTNHATVLRKGHYNMVYAPEGSADLKLKKGKYDFFFVEFNAAYLKTIFKHFPVLDEFLAKVNGKLPVIMCETHPHITPSMFDCIHHIIGCDFQGTLRDQYLGTKFAQLMLLSLDVCKNVAAGPNDEERLRILMLKEFIQQNLRFQLDVNFLADKIRMNRRKFENSFKQVHGTTVYDFVLAEKMRKASELLVTTDLPIRDIAAAVGYKSPSNFSKVFKKKFGHSPGELRRRRGEPGLRNS